MTSVPSVAEAQYGGRGGSSYQSKINKLDDNIVKKLPIPILFGVELSDITDNYGDPRDGGSRTHEGLDIMAPEGAPIVSPTDAVVIRTGNGSGSGKYVTTANPGGETFVYMHLEEILVKNGAVLKIGDLIGYVGDTGNASGGQPHLHLEIRTNRKPTDPYPRISEEFTLTEKMKFLDDVLDDAKDEDELVEFLAEEYSAVFYQAQASKIALPKALSKELPTPTAASSRDLDIGDEGTDVMVLQSRLIAEGYLDIGTPTGYFGALTKEALRNYQVAKGIIPSNGYFGGTTRSNLFGESSTKPTMSRSEMLDKIEELTILLKKLQALQ